MTRSRKTKTRERIWLTHLLGRDGSEPTRRAQDDPGPIDFIETLATDPATLTILGGGRQETSIHIDDCVDAMRHVCEHADGPLATYNLGTRTTTSVTRIADELALEPASE